MKALSVYFFFLLFLGQNVCGQKDAGIICDSFTLDINVKGMDTGKVMLLYFGCDDAGTSRKANLKKGMVKFNGRVNRATEALFFTNPNVQNLDDSSIIRFIVEPGKMMLSCETVKGKPVNIRIEGSVAQSQKERWDEENAGLIREKDNLGQLIAEKLNNRGAADSSLLKRQTERLIFRKDSLYARLLENAFTYISTHPDSYFGGYLLNKYYSRMPIDTLKRYYLSQNQVVKNSYFGRSVLNYLYSLSDENFRRENDYLELSDELKNITNLFDVTLQDVNGQAVALSRFRGKPTLLFFWGSWCGPCHRQAPFLAKLMEEKGMEAINFISVSLNTNSKDWLESLKKFNIPGINLIDAKNILRLHYKFLAVPQYIFIDADGSVINADAPQAGTAGLRNLLKERLRH